MTIRKILLAMNFLCIPCLSSSFSATVPNTPADDLREIVYETPEPLFISLGADCCVTQTLEAEGYRRAAFPFDWLLSLDHKKMVELLEHDFKYFLDPSLYSNVRNGALGHMYYHIEFRHEHDNDFFGKYKRRIERFRNLKNYLGKVFFIRKPHQHAHSDVEWPSKDLLFISFEHAVELKNALLKIFPILDFNLIIINFYLEDFDFKIVDDIILVNTKSLCDLPSVFARAIEFSQKPKVSPSTFTPLLEIIDP